ncbi:unnamed protein product [Schistosoma curassoni]|uniref:HCO3_cotransp domain-containing protein n=1 Tax=Schistosoma curassoni TaxID=6186 RepID=A0A183KZB8_9TREM|nr:unnamed protein product [Schistosoma curassoni]
MAGITSYHKLNNKIKMNFSKSVNLLHIIEGCISLSSSQVGALLLCGQIANGLATPLIGYLSDRPLGLTEKPATVHQSITCEDGSVKKDKRLFNRMKRQLRLGQRKSWHLGGCLLMLVAFPLMFGQPEYFVGLPIVVKLLINGMLIICVQVPNNRVSNCGHLQDTFPWFLCPVKSDELTKR